MRMHIFEWSYTELMSLKHAVLGFLAIEPMSGYDLKKAFDASVGHFWTADQAQIYRTLARLVEEGMVEIRQVAQDRRPDRNEHRLTNSGTIELDTWLATAASAWPTREPFLLRIFFAGRLDRELVQTMLVQRIEEGEQLLATLIATGSTIDHESADTTIDFEAKLRLATLDNGLRHVRAEIAWATTLLKQI